MNSNVWEQSQQELVNFFFLTLLNRCVKCYRQFENVHSTKNCKVLTVCQANDRFSTDHDTENSWSSPYREMVVGGRQMRVAPSRMHCPHTLMQVCAGVGGALEGASACAWGAPGGVQRRGRSFTGAGIYP